MKRLKQWLPTRLVTLALAVFAGSMALAAFWFLLGGRLLAAFIYANPHSVFESPVMTPKEIQIEIGEAPAALERRYGKSVESNKKNFGTEFYTIDWPTQESGVVILKNSATEVRLDIVLGVSGTYDSIYPEEGFSGYKMLLGLSPKDNIPHDEARQKFFAMLQKIRQAGWTRWIEPSHPRLNGEYAYHYQITKKDLNYCLDSELMPSMEVWMKLKDRSDWAFYLNDVFMDVRLSRDSSKLNPNLPGDYFISIELNSKNENQRSELAGDERKKWRELYPAIRKKHAQIRLESENKLRLLNYKIDVKYKNPDE